MRERNEDFFVGAGGSFSVLITSDVSGNTIVGAEVPNLSGTNNTFITSQVSAFIPATTATNNVFIGRSSGEDLTTGQTNTAVGSGAMKNVTSQLNNVAVGYLAMCNLGAATCDSVAIGTNALCGGSGLGMVAVGYRAGCGINNAGGSVIIGSGAGICGNVCNTVYIGAAAGQTNNTNPNIVIGSSANAQTFACTIVIGNNATPTKNGQVVLGSTTYTLATSATAADGGLTQSYFPDTYLDVRINGVNYKLALYV